MLTYLSPRTHMPHSSSPLNPQRSSSPPLSSPTRTGVRSSGSGSGSLPRFSVPSIKSSPTTPTGRPNLFSSPRSSPSRPLSTRYMRTTPSSSIAARRPRTTSTQPLSSPTADPFGEGNGATPTQNAMWRDRLQRRMADRERRKAARDNDLARRRGMMDMDDDDDEAERQAQADDEELFRHLMVLQRRREQHALAGYSAESVEFWQDEADLAREEIALCARLNQMDTEVGHLTPTLEDQWAHEAAEAEAAETYVPEYAVETAHGYDDFHWEELDNEDEQDMHLGPEDWAAIQAMEDAMDEAMDVE